MNNDIGTIKIKIELLVDDPEVTFDDIENMIRNEAGEIKKELQKKLNIADREKDINYETSLAREDLPLSQEAIFIGIIAFTVSRAIYYIVQEAVLKPVVIPRIKNLLKKYGVIKNIEIMDD